MAVNWNYFDKYDDVMEKYLPTEGEGETKATQIAVCVSKLVYKYYNDGDVFDNTHGLEGWANDLSDFANWLYYHTTDNAENILNKILICANESDYEDLLKELADELLQEDYLVEQNKIEKEKTVYDCVGKFKFVEQDAEDEYELDDEDYNDEEDYY